MSLRLPRHSSLRSAALLQRLLVCPHQRRAYRLPLPSTPLTPVTSKLELPPESEWRRHFPPAVRVNHRVSIRNAETAAKIADAFVPAGSVGKVIVEAFPGPGQLSRALLNLPRERIRKMIIMEDWPQYLDFLRPLQEADPRVTVIDRDGYTWDSYQHITELGLLDEVERLPWDQGVHPQLHFISHLPSTVTGEQLISQLLRTLPEREWLFQYGRIPLSLILSEHVFKRITSSTSAPNTRNKLSIVAEASSTCTAALPPALLSPFDAHFHPVSTSPHAKPAENKRSSRAVGLPFTSMNIVPHRESEQLIGRGKMDMWDYVLRRMFVKKATEVAKALPSLAPGAQTLAKMLTDPDRPEHERLDVKKKVNKLEAHEWALLVKAFDEWPFKPAMFDIAETFSDHSRL
ncbi:putative class I-like SAM-binding methyltransferase superfamily, rRNA adenine N(6)-methyltransferase family protein [Lyophyllum shimeji]|uniref:rRNA adenine N(6)-methyltransferase n=1 Tax=Lyophyllum shimeji TaxID=47721 RepID=A0A9P3UTZ0_LYOSH|nr:putative class I-like SAM-binding methyltransferase superfamily, rRNA adenine N(6)-methyltransferase family protein [Lyophyllum shimeji]